MCIRDRVKMVIYKTILRPLLVYGSECWALNTAQMGRVEATEMRVLRLIEGVTLRDRRRSEEIRRELRIGSTTKHMQQNQLRWYGHLKRMEEGTGPRKMLEWTPVAVDLRADRRKDGRMRWKMQ